jgi:hypothetical protein
VASVFVSGCAAALFSCAVVNRPIARRHSLLQKVCVAAFMGSPRPVGSATLSTVEHCINVSFCIMLAQTLGSGEDVRVSDRWSHQTRGGRRNSNSSMHNTSGNLSNRRRNIGRGPGS